MCKSSRTDLICYFLLLALHIGLVWWLPYFPTQDGPSHLYNLVILHDLLNGGKEWGAFFTHHLRPVPNLGFHFIAYPLISFFAPQVVEKLFVSFYIVLLGSAVPFFLRSFDRPVFPFAYLVFPVVFNFTLLMGFYSYVIAVPLFLIAFSLGWKHRAASPVFKFFCLNLAGLAVFYCHLIPFVFFVIALAVIALVEPNGLKKKALELFKLLITILPLLVLFVLYQAGRSKGIHLSFTYLASLARLMDLTEHLFFFSMTTFARLQLVPAALIVLFFLFFLAVYGLEMLKAGSGLGPYNPRIPAAEKTLLILSLLLVTIYYMAPFRLGEGSYFNQRFPWVIFLLMLPLLRIPEKLISGRLASSVILCAVIPVFFCNVLAIAQQSAKVGEFLHGLDADLPRGAFVMAYKTKFPEWSDIDVLMHVSSYYGLYKGCVDIGNYEAGLPYFPVRFRETLPPFPSQDTITYKPADISWSHYPCIGYLFAWDLGAGERNGLEKEFHIIMENGRLTVWRRNYLAPEMPITENVLQYRN